MGEKVIAGRLKELRGAETQKKTAEAIGVAQSTYAMYETGQRIPADDKKVRIAKYYNKTVQEIFYD